MNNTIPFEINTQPLNGIAENNNPHIEEETSNIQNDAEQEVNTKELTKKFFDEVIRNSHTIPHDPKFPFIKWYSNDLQKWRANNPDATFEDWISENNKRVQKNRKWKEGFGMASAILAICLGIGIAFGAPALLAIIPGVAALINGIISIWKGAQLNRDIEGRGYLLKSMEDKMHHMIANISKKIDTLPDGETKIKAQTKLDEAINEMQEFKKDHYKASVFIKKWSSMGLRQGIGYAISAARLVIGILIIAGVITSLPLGVTLGLLGASLLCEFAGFVLYRASHNERDKMMSNNGKQIQKCLNHCIDLHKQYGTVEKAGITREGIKNIEDLQNLQLLNKYNAKKQLSKIDGLKHQCKHNHNHGHKKHSHGYKNEKCQHNHNHKHSTVKLEDLLTNRSQLYDTHIHYPKGVLGKPITAYSNITQNVSKSISKCFERKQNKVAQMQMQK